MGEHDGGIRKKGTSQGTEARVSQMGDWTLVMLYGHKFLHDRALLSLCSFRYVKTFAPIYLTPRNDPGACTDSTDAMCTMIGMAKELMGEEPAANGIGFCLVGLPFLATCAFRQQVRAHYNIWGHSLIDAFCAVFCLQCSLCQIYRQLKAKPILRSKLSSSFSSHLYECYQVNFSC